ncbi:MAG: SOS response-associated peptidase [Lactobacillus sp.]|jgi:putative SOS response-associated peptidase YedK|nr:SOS response-associated peptidase [Lactobacillus sp.]MCH3990610.1 SOS response-associated peptidase [Lactobacillus sp.]MCH4068674.1 SOS response-associated peptidase [Lactobacillus sp.]MCI1303841.1 SOS response-associated peptidase [Lactobacillus sp.]MCI1330225.1 SOS response-associated peptidase [Lactobacillus sp.]
MCHHFTLPELKLIRQYLLNDLNLPLVETALPAMPREIFPKGLAPVLLYQNNKLQLVPKVWGYPNPRKPKQVIFNARIERFFESRPSMWDQSFARQRCLILAQNFYETDRNKHNYSFTMPNQPLTLIAGIYDGDHFAMVTTEPNSTMVSVHNRMPLVLEPAELRRWLFQNFTNLINRQTTPLAKQQLPDQ